MPYRIILDAGHGGFDNGAVYRGRREKDDSLRLALEVGDKLVQHGLLVSYTRTTDVYRNVNDRIHIANHSNADLFISLHRNSSPYPNTYRGVETLLYNVGDEKEVLANQINYALNQVGFRNLGICQRQDIPVLKYTNMAALLVEVGFIHSNCDNDIFDDYFDEMASAIATGIMKAISKPESYQCSSCEIT